MKRHRPLPSQTTTTAGTPTITTFYTSKKPNLSTLKTPSNNWAPLNLNKSELNLPLTFPTGQTFRWKQTTPFQFTGVIGPHLISLKQIQDFSCQNDVVFYCFHNSHNKTAAKSALLDFLNMGICLKDLWVGFSACDPRFAELAVCLSGARVLRQDPLECLIQFICSSNNNIKRITQMVDFVSSLGKFLGCVEGVEFYEFPSLDRLSEVSEDEFRKAGFGYRLVLLLLIKL